MFHLFYDDFLLRLRIVFPIQVAQSVGAVTPGAFFLHNVHKFYCGTINTEDWRTCLKISNAVPGATDDRRPRRQLVADVGPDPGLLLSILAKSAPFLKWVVLASGWG